MRIVESTYSIGEIAEWVRDRSLIVNEDYQRGSGLWPRTAMSYFIDTILKGFPFPKIYFYETVDREKKRVRREIVDGQQRVRTIVDFLENRFELSSTSRDFQGMKFEDLEDQAKDAFYSYTVAVDVIRNTERSDILQMFRRMNAYTLPLNEAEKRQATYFGEFKTWINTTLDEFESMLADWQVFSSRQMLRQAAAELIADLVLAIDSGIISTSPKKLNDLYEKNDKQFVDRPNVDEKLTGALTFIRADMSFIQGTFLTKPHIFHSLICAMIQNCWGLPNGAEETGIEPNGRFWRSREAARPQLLALASAHEEKDSSRYGEYVTASSEGGNRAPQRSTRTRWLCLALRGEL